MSPALSASIFLPSNATAARGRRLLRPVASGVLAMLLLGLAGCASLRSDQAYFSQDGLLRVNTYGRSVLYVRPDHQIGRYDDLMLDQIGFRYSRNQDPLEEEDEDAIRQMLARVVEHGSQDGTVGISNLPGPCVLSVGLYLLDLELREPAHDGSHSAFLSSYGSATMVLELRDSISDAPLARLVERRGLGGGNNLGSTNTQLHRLGRTIGDAMSDMGSQLEKVTPPTAGQWDHSCQGGMAALASTAR